MEYATIDAFKRDPRKVWEFYGLRLRVLADAEPNTAHLALAELERRGLARARDAERRHAPRARRLAGRGRGTRLDPHRRLPCRRHPRAAGGGRPARGRARRAAVPGLRRDPQARRRHVRRAPPDARDRPGDAARARGAAAARRRLDAGGVAGGRAAARDAGGGGRGRDRQPRADGVRQPGRAEARRERGERCRRSSMHLGAVRRPGSVAARRPPRRAAEVLLEAGGAVAEDFPDELAPAPVPVAAAARSPRDPAAHAPGRRARLRDGRRRRLARVREHARRASDLFFEDPQWAGLADWRAELAPHYRTARGCSAQPPFRPRRRPTSSCARSQGGWASRTLSGRPTSLSSSASPASQSPTRTSAGRARAASGARTAAAA